jgi:hypothetical protein
MQLLHGSLLYRDERLAAYDAAAVVKLVEHLDRSRLDAFVPVVFEHALLRDGRRDDPEELQHPLPRPAPGDTRHLDDGATAQRDRPKPHGQRRDFSAARPF